MTHKDRELCILEVGLMDIVQQVHNTLCSYVMHCMVWFGQFKKKKTWDWVRPPRWFKFPTLTGKN